VCGAKALPAAKHPLDVLRGNKNLPGWGASGVDHAQIIRIDEDASNLYSYPIAVFARLVAEDQSLQAVYGNDALRYTNAILQTAWALMPQIEQHTAGNFTEAYLTELQAYSTMPNATECLQAYKWMKLQMDSGKILPNDKPAYDRLGQQLDNCNNLSCVAGAPVAHNESGLYFMVLMELRRVLDSDFYRASAGQSNLAEISRKLFPALIAHHHRYFVNRLQVKADPRGERYYWHYQDDQPSCLKSRGDPENVEHGQLDMRYMGVLLSYRNWLNAHPPASDEPFPLDSAQLQHFANTFLEEIAPGPNLKGTVDGAPPTEDNNALCDGWINLAIVDPRVYQKCRQIAQQVIVGGCRRDCVDPSQACQPYLGIGIHSSLLMNKRFAGTH
jgi:hypothetical protein